MPAIVSIAYSPTHLPAEPHDHYQRVPVTEAALVVGHGIQGDRKGSSPTRQLNIMSAEELAPLAAAGFKLAPGQMGEQIVISGLDLAALQPGAQFQLGATAVVEVHDHRNGCQRFEHIQGHSPKEAAGRLGVMAKVVTAGPIAVGDPVRLLTAETA
jgi:MOSC domain-containing protein YiiM